MQDRSGLIDLLQRNNLFELFAKYELFADRRISDTVDALDYNDGFYSTNTKLTDHSIGTINLNKVLGPANNKSDKLGLYNWAGGLFMGLSRHKHNLEMLSGNPEYYWENNLKDIEFASFDSGVTYYIRAGNHRAYIAKLLFILEEKVLGSSSHELAGVMLQHYKLK